MRSTRKAAPLLLALAVLCVACSRDESAQPPESTAGSFDVVDSSTAAPPTSSGHDPAGVDTTGTAVVVSYEHVRTCSRFMGREGQFFAYRIVSVRNGGAAPFTLEPAMLRFTGDPATAAPAFSVPELSDLEVAPGATKPSTEQFLLKRSGGGAPPRGAMPLGYGAPDIAFVRGAAEPEYDEGTGCDEFNT